MAAKRRFTRQRIKGKQNSSNSSSKTLKIIVGKRPVRCEVNPEQYENFPKHCSRLFFEKNFERWALYPKEEREILKKINAMIFLSRFGKNFGPLSSKKRKFNICVLGVHGISGISETRQKSISDYLRERGLSDFFNVFRTSFAEKNLRTAITNSNIIFPLFDLPILQKFSQGKYNISANELRKISQRYRGGINFDEIVKERNLDKSFFTEILSKSETFLRVLDDLIATMKIRKQDIESIINFVALRSILASQGKAYSFEDTLHERY